MTTPAKHAPSPREVYAGFMREAEGIPAPLSQRVTAPTGRRAERVSVGAIKEETIHRALVGHLLVRCVPGVWWHHSPNGGNRHAAVGGMLKAMGTKPGVPDLMFIREGRVLFLELKRRGGALSPAQKECHRHLAAAGAIVLVAYGLDQALATLLNAGILKPTADARSTAPCGRLPTGQSEGAT